MSNLDVIRAWRDEEYRLSLCDKQRTALPANPAGAVDLTDFELGSVAGAWTPASVEICHTDFCTEIGPRCGD